jgi:hypothetical protein
MDIRIIKSSDVTRCPITSLDRDHYRDDGTCRCDERTD